MTPTLIAEPGARPSALLQALELPRAAAELTAFTSAAPLLRLAPRGDGGPVLVLPGFTAGDSSTEALRTYLAGQGHAVVGWGLGRNDGPTRRVLRGLDRALDELCDQYGRPVSLVGWSLGGIYARELALRHPERVRRVVTLGSPYRMWHPAQSRATALYDGYAYRHAVPQEEGAPRGPAARPLRVPATSIFTRTDGIVAWGTCREPETDLAESIEVPGSHCGLGHNPLAVYAVADRLAQPGRTMTRFTPPPAFRALYP